jgi:hypothetical protein
MSRVLRRPMFRGGSVDSRGTGITSGLDEGYADGGRVGFQRGGYSTIPGIDDLSQVGIYDPYTRLSSFAGPGPQYITPRQRRGLPQRQTIPNYYTGTARQQMQQRQEDLRTQAQAEQEEASSSEFAKAFVPTPNITTNKNLGGIKNNVLTDEEDIKKQTELYQRLLGGDEAKKQAIYDALLAASPAFFKGKNLREAAPEVLTAINKSGAFDKPRDIKQAAAQLAIQRQMMKDKATAEERSRLEYLRLQQGFKEPSITDRLVKLGAQDSFGGNLPSDVKKAVPGKFYLDANGKLIKVVQDPKTKQVDFIEYPD